MAALPDGYGERSVAVRLCSSSSRSRTRPGGDTQLRKTPCAPTSR
ncbi:hypothetical protein [Lysobacter gummosus]